MGLGFVFFSKSRMLYFKREVEVWKFPKKKSQNPEGGLAFYSGKPYMCMPLAGTVNPVKS